MTFAHFSPHLSPGGLTRGDTVGGRPSAATLWGSPLRWRSPRLPGQQGTPWLPRGAAEGRLPGVFPQDMRRVCNGGLNWTFYHPTPSAQKSGHLLRLRAWGTPSEVAPSRGGPLGYHRMPLWANVRPQGTPLGDLQGGRVTFGVKMQ